MIGDKKMKCNYCKAETEHLYYLDVECGYTKLFVRKPNKEGKSFEKVGFMKYCPECGNVQVDVKK